MNSLRSGLVRSIATLALWAAGASVVLADEPLAIRPWPMPLIAAVASQPDLVVDHDRNLLLAWIEKGADGAHALRLSRAGPGTTWQLPRTIASGRDWFVNWADTPHLIALDDGTLWAHWLRRNGEGVYDYGIALTQSANGGSTWSAPIRVEPEGAKNDYGFVSMWQHTPDTLGLAWLDSRQKPVEHDAAHDHAHAGAAMSLRAATFDAQGKRAIEWPLDASTCDCCTTSSALTLRGPVVVYRGRSAGDIRDTRLVRFDGRRWTAPVSVHDDGWHFAGCPVNGPAVATSSNDVWVAWYTEAGGQPSLRLARSRDAGDTFSPPLTIAAGNGMLGRVAIAIDGGMVWVLWITEREGQGQHLRLARIDAHSGVIRNEQSIADIAARGRASGLPRLQVHDAVAHIVWTDAVDGKPVLRGVSVR